MEHGIPLVGTKALLQAWCSPHSMTLAIPKPDEIFSELQHRMRNRGSKKGRKQKSSNKANTISTTTITTTTTKG